MIITLLTDFGLRDAYVGAMKGVILGVCPGARIFDISHEIPPQNVAWAAALLPSYAPFFPAGTTHVAIVDPGVGSGRRAIALETPALRIVAPDNGLITPIWRDALARHGRDALALVSLDNPRFWRDTPSATFHGRDIFAPAAAHLAAGVPVAELGSAVDEPVLLPSSNPRRKKDGTIIGRVAMVDHFGNCITNVSAGHLATLGPHASLVVKAGGATLSGVRRTYADVVEGEPLALVGSSGALELAVRNGSAAERLGLRAGDEVVIAGG